jgi:hypothetical protein
MTKMTIHFSSIQNCLCLFTLPIVQFFFASCSSRPPCASTRWALVFALLRCWTLTVLSCAPLRLTCTPDPYIQGAHGPPIHQICPQIFFLGQNPSPCPMTSVSRHLVNCDIIFLNWTPQSLAQLCQHPVRPCPIFYLTGTTDFKDCPPLFLWPQPLCWLPPWPRALDPLAAVKLIMPPGLDSQTCHKNLINIA